MINDYGILYLFRFQKLDLMAPPISTIDPYSNQIFIYFRLIEKEDGMIFILQINGNGPAYLADINFINRSQVIRALQYDMTSGRLFALIQRPLLPNSPIGSMLVVCSAVYVQLRPMVWEEEFLIQDVDLSSRLIHASFTFADFNDTVVRPDRFLNMLYEDNTVVAIDMYNHKVVVNIRPYQKLEALALIAREKLS